MKYFIALSSILMFNAASGQIKKSKSSGFTRQLVGHNQRAAIRSELQNQQDSFDTKIRFSAGSNSLDFVPFSSFNNGLLIEPINSITNNSIPTSFYSGAGGSWSFHTNGIQRFGIDSGGYISTSNSSLLINGASPSQFLSMNVHGNAGFDSSIVLGEISDSSSFLSLNLGFKSTYVDEDDKRSVYTKTPITWAGGRKLPVFRLRHPNTVTSGSLSSNQSTGRDFMILPYEYGMAIEYNGVVECWVGEWSIHRGDLYNDMEGQGNGWGGILWVGDDRDGGGVRATARNNLASGGNVNYGEVSVEKFAGGPNGDFRLRLPSKNNQFHFVYGGRGSTDIIAKLSDKGFVMPVVDAAAAILTPEKGQIYFDSTEAAFMGYDGNGWVNLSSKLITGSTTISANNGQTVYQIAHNLGVIPSYFNVVATTADAGGIQYVNADDTYLRVYYATPPTAGNNNLSWNWQIKK